MVPLLFDRGVDGEGNNSYHRFFSRQLEAMEGGKGRTGRGLGREGWNSS